MAPMAMLTNVGTMPTSSEMREPIGQELDVEGLVEPKLMRHALDDRLVGMLAHHGGNGVSWHDT